MLEDLKKQLIQIEKSVTNGLKNITSFNIRLNELKKNYDEIRPDLIKIQENCLYWFEAETITEAENLIEELENKRIYLNEKKRRVPKKNKNKGSCVIYVGVRQGGTPTKKDNSTKFGGRIYQHFGLYDKGGTQGLQLNYWANCAEIRLTLKVIELDIENLKHLYIIEKMFSIKLNPLLGFH